MPSTVMNQAPAFSNINLFELDTPLREAVDREGASWAAALLAECGEVAGSEEGQEHARRAERNDPKLRTHDRSGRRIDEVEYDPSWGWLLRGGVERGIHALPWAKDAQSGSHVARGALLYLWTQLNPGVLCPISMTYSAIPALRIDKEISSQWEPRLTSLDFGTVALAGMAMTEKQGGSDVRANVTEAHPDGQGTYTLNGHKWFCSHPMGNVFLVLAQAPGGLTCFVVERGSGFHVMRLKDKLGTRSLASSEVEFIDLRAHRLGEEGRGVATIIEMVAHTRLDCVLGSAATMRKAVSEAVHYASHRMAFGATLVQQPLMQNVLSDLAVESEAATAAALRLARAYDETNNGPFRRLATAVLKYWICKRTTPVVVEALECLGGNGYTEDWPMAQLLRDSPLNSIWEGSGNVIALDILRTIVREPQAVEQFLAECELVRGANRRFDEHINRLTATLRVSDQPASPIDQWSARQLAGDLALALQGATLIANTPPAVSDAYCESRLHPQTAQTFGLLPRATDHQAVLARTLPT